MKVESLHIYPIKASKQVSLHTATCDHRGFVGDRRFMVVDMNQQFLTQRDTPALGLIDAHVSPTGITLAAPNMPQLALALPESDDIEVTVWRDTVAAQPISAANSWLAELLGTEASLVYMPDRSKRETSVGGWVSFADGYPFLLTNTASLNDLNSRIDSCDVEMRAFRPNIVVDCDEAWVEDRWKKIGIGDAVFELISPCVRCKVTTLNPDDPTDVNTAQEPLRTLAEFRRNAQSGGVTFGWNAMCLTPGIAISEGDTVSSID